MPYKVVYLYLFIVPCKWQSAVQTKLNWSSLERIAFLKTFLISLFFVYSSNRRSQTSSKQIWASQNFNPSAQCISLKWCQGSSSPYLLFLNGLCGRDDLFKLHALDLVINMMKPGQSPSGSFWNHNVSTSKLKNAWCLRYDVIHGFCFLTIIHELKEWSQILLLRAGARHET